MASYPVIRARDVLSYTGGMLLPIQVYQLNRYTLVNSGWTTGYIGFEPAPLGMLIVSGASRVIPSYMASSLAYPCWGINPKCVSASTYYAMPMSADVGSYTYAAFPYQKLIDLTIYEDLTGSVNFEYFYIQDYKTTKTTTIDSYTWSSISGSWNGRLWCELLTGYTGTLNLKFGGMNSKRRIYYSDNVVSPGTWSYLGAYNGVNGRPGIEFCKKTAIASGVTYAPDPYQASYSTRAMNTIEYLYRLRQIVIGVGYSSTPGKAAASASYQENWHYTSVCSRDTCGCDCNDSSCSIYTS